MCIHLIIYQTVISNFLTVYDNFYLFSIYLSICLYKYSQCLGIHLQICPRGVTCCTPEMESKLWTLTRESFTSSLSSTTKHLQALFQTKSRLFSGKIYMCPILACPNPSWLCIIHFSFLFFIHILSAFLEILLLQFILCPHQS